LVITNLPVIILKGAILLPHCELRLELKDDVDKKVLKISEEKYNNNVLIVSPIDQLDENIDTKNLPKIATVAKINLNMEISNNITRVVIEGIRRVNVTEYNTTNEDKLLEASIRPTTQFAIAPKDEIALIRKIIKELEIYVSTVPYMSNSILAQVTQENTLAY
jgi:ATP-dependent Lon protease